MLDFSCSRQGQIEAETYSFPPMSINNLSNSEGVLQRIRSQPGDNLETDPHSQRYLWHNLAANLPLECHLGHIPVSVIAWRDTEILESRVSHLVRKIYLANEG